jgi:hypothetical protein
MAELENPAARYVVPDLEAADNPDCLAVDAFFENLDTNGVHKRVFNQAMRTPHVRLLDTFGTCAYCQAPGDKHVKVES